MTTGNATIKARIEAAPTLAVVRPDLSARTVLSKSAVVGWDLCPTKAGFEMTARRPLIMNEKISFGSALDAACEALIVGHREGWTEEAAMKAAADAVGFVVDRDSIELPIDEMDKAVTGFWREVMPRLPLEGAELQPEIAAVIPGLGEVQGHPDIILASGPWDVKSSRYKKDLPSVELGLYAILLEEARGIEVTEAGYLTWVRSGRGRWEIQPWQITSEARRWAWARVNQYVKAAQSGAFYGAPKYPALCQSCQYAPANGGECEIAWNGEEAAA
jgi:CRISPR/Cas system-associated exonuclease Cas4 (RecB family)